jgi:hypothetical protein
MNVLIITDVLWRNDNGVGNSYSNLFKDMDGVKIANICCMEGVSDNEESTSCLQISEGMLLRNLKTQNRLTVLCHSFQMMMLQSIRPR